jgi:hypothetical protein
MLALISLILFVSLALHVDISNKWVKTRKYEIVCVCALADYSS